MNSLPLKFKKEILQFCKEYETLANPRKIRITIPQREIVAGIVWDSDDYITVDEESIQKSLDEELMYKSKTILEINKNIKEFIKRTQSFGRKNFKLTDWLWFEVLWTYRPEKGENFKADSVKWVKDYSID